MTTKRNLNFPEFSSKINYAEDRLASSYLHHVTHRVIHPGKNSRFPIFPIVPSLKRGNPVQSVIKERRVPGNIRNLLP